MRLSEIKIHTGLTFNTTKSHSDKLNGGWIYSLKAYEYGRNVGELTYYFTDYDTDNEGDELTIFIDYVKVSENFRRLGIATALYNELRNDYPGYKLTNSGRTPEGHKFRQAYDEYSKSN